jgi:hypothetical protein
MEPDAMEKKYTEEELISKVFEANKQRGKYLAFIVKELDKAGIQGIDDVLKRAIFNYGKDKASGWGNLSARGFMERMMGDEIGRGTFGFEEVGASTGERAEFRFHRCPLEEGWKEMGLSAEERHRLCAIAREHDFGLVTNEANEDLELEMPEAIGLGDPVCHLIIRRKE